MGLPRGPAPRRAYNSDQDSTPHRCLGRPWAARRPGRFIQRAASTARTRIQAALQPSTYLLSTYLIAWVSSWHLRLWPVCPSC